jgi:hypothetical protein
LEGVTIETDRSGAPPVAASFQSLAARLSRVLGVADTSSLDVAVSTCLEQLGAFVDDDLAFVTLVDDDECVSERATKFCVSSPTRCAGRFADAISWRASAATSS